MKDIRSPIWLDIETGGIDPSKSSILSIAAGQGTDIRSVFSRPEAGTFLSTFSEEKILPQLRGKTLLSEKISIESLISTLEKSPKIPIAGFNIRGFDLGFIQRRARTYGLEKRFLDTTRRREILDPIYQVKDIVAGAISSHADRGTFSSALGGKSWAEAEAAFGDLPFKQRPQEYNLIAQVKGYLTANRETAMFKGWKLEDLNALLPGQVKGTAHEALTDILMTQRVSDAARTGLLASELNKPSRALQWMNTVKQRGYHQFGAGRLLAQADIERLTPTVANKARQLFDTHFIQNTPRTMKIGAVGIAAALALSAFSGKDDNYNSIEGLPHGGFAQSGRLQLTDFGSGWQGTAGALRRAERLYKSSIRATLREAGHTGKINWLSHLDEDTGEMVLAARNAAGERLMGVQRTFKKGSVDLTSIEVDPALRGGIGRKFYEYEHRMLKRLGFEGAEVTSPVANPVTGRMQAQLYGSKPSSLFTRDIESAYGVSREEFQQMLMNKQMTKAQWEVSGLAPTFIGKIPARNSANNTMDGMGHSGIGARIRKLLTPFGSKWDGMRNLVKGTETFQEMLASTGFQKALSQAKKVQELGAGSFGTAYQMKGIFRGQEFSFVRKIGDIQKEEAGIQRMFQEEFAPTVYREKIRSGKSILDMEKFEGESFHIAQPESQHWLQATENMLATHARGISHSDLHAGNLMLTKEGNVGVIDWGASGKIGSEVDLIQGRGSPTAKSVTIKTTRNTNLEYRSTQHDIEILKESMEELGHSTSSVQETIFSSQPRTNVSRRKVSQSSLQRSATATAWAAGKSGGKRSRI